MRFLALTFAAVLVAAAGFTAGALARGSAADEHAPLRLGNFSVSLAVKDLAASQEFYSTLGFEPVGGDATQNWLILQNGTVNIGLFQGMFDENIMTFNPGWNAKQETLSDFDDVREIQARLKAAGIELALETDPEGTGVGHIVLQDPDGNQIMFDQHVPAPRN